MTYHQAKGAYHTGEGEGGDIVYVSFLDGQEEGHESYPVLARALSEATVIADYADDGRLFGVEIIGVPWTEDEVAEEGRRMLKFRPQWPEVQGKHENPPSQ